MVEELLSTVGAVVRNNKNRLTVTYDPNVGEIHADVTKTRQILFNLLSNAAKFTTGGNVSVHAGRKKADGVDCIEFIVSDDGIGLTEEQQRRLFRPFAQGDTSISRKYGGTGLGLALVWRFCQLMGGEVSVKSEPKKGATFTVRLPATVKVPTERQRAAASSTPLAAA